MGEILKAYQTLNRVLNLGLTKEQFLAAEAQFKLDFADRVKFPSSLQSDPMKLSADWEVTATLTPRRTAIKTVTRQNLAQLTTAAQKQMATKLGTATKATTKTPTTRTTTTMPSTTARTSSKTS
jgi:hypothetical protein